MKKIIVLLSFLVAFSTMPGMAFAVTDCVNEEKQINSVREFKKEMNQLSTDGFISQTERMYLAENTDEAVVAEFIGEKLDEAVDILNDTSVNQEMLTLTDGQEYKQGVYDLGDGCQLIVELEDRAETDNGSATIRATSGSNTLWKEYGNRYFTATAKVAFSLGTATMKLRNHYTLSSKGIDERYGVESFILSSDGGSIRATDPEITDATARTVGESDVNMECYFTLTYPTEYTYDMKKEYVLESRVGFVDIDKTAEKIKVKQSWTLTRI